MDISLQDDQQLVLVYTIALCFDVTANPVSSQFLSQDYWNEQKSCADAMRVDRPPWLGTLGVN